MARFNGENEMRKKLTKEHCKKISEALKGNECYKNPERGKHISEACKGRIPWNKGKKGVQIAWNKNLTKKIDERVKKYSDKLKMSYDTNPNLKCGFKEGQNSKEKNINWHGGKSFELYSEQWTNELRTTIKTRDNFSCKLCNIKIKEKRRIKRNPQKNWLVVHHIDYNKKNCNSNNLISLCHSCHMKTNHNRNKWSTHFNGI